MADDYQDVERNHSFDGITEYDNRVPAWLNALFLLSTVWAIGYMGWYFLGGGSIGVGAYEAERAEILRAKLESGGGIPDEETLRQLSHDDEQVARGRELYFGKGACTSCHGQDGLGLSGVGPNLRDDRWLYGHDMTDLIETLQNGRNNGSMPSQAAILTEQEMIAVASFIADWNRTAKANDQGYVKEGSELDPIDY